MSNPSTGLTVVDESGSGVRPIQQAGNAFDTTGDFSLRLWSSFPPAEQAKVIALVQGQTTPLSNLIGKQIGIKHIVAHNVELVDEDTGEVSQADRIIIIDQKGEAYSCVSEGIRKSLQLLMAFNGTPPWVPALQVEVAQLNTRKGHRTYVLNPIAVKGG